MSRGSARFTLRHRHGGRKTKHEDDYKKLFHLLGTKKPSNAAIQWAR